MSQRLNYNNIPLLLIVGIDDFIPFVFYLPMIFVSD